MLERGGNLRFSIRPLTVWDYDAFDFMERLSDGNRLIIGGVVVARGTHRGDHEKAAPSPRMRTFRLNNSNEGCYLERFELLRR